MSPSEDRTALLHGALAQNSADILAYLERRVSEREDAADLLGETMLVAWRRLRALPAEAEPARMWLFVIARNTLLNYRRGNRRRLQVAESLRAQLLMAAPRDDADAAHDLREAIARLPDDLGEIIRLVHWDGFSQADVATMLKIPAATVRGRYARARELLREHLGAYRATEDARRA